MAGCFENASHRYEPGPAAYHYLFQFNVPKQIAEKSGTETNTKGITTVHRRKKEGTNERESALGGFLPFSSITFASVHTGARSVHVLAAAGQRDLLYPLADGILLARWKRRLKPIGTLFPFRGCVCVDCKGSILDRVSFSGKRFIAFFPLSRFRSVRLQLQQFGSNFQASKKVSITSVLCIAFLVDDYKVALLIFQTLSNSYSANFDTICWKCIPRKHTLTSYTSRKQLHTNSETTHEFIWLYHHGEANQAQPPIVGGNGAAPTWPTGRDCKINYTDISSQ